MDKIIKVPLKTTPTIDLSVEFRRFYGEVTAIDANHKSASITSFKMKDLELVPAPKEGMTGVEFMEYITGEGYIPLNAFHAEAIFCSGENIANLNKTLWPYWRKKDFKLEAVTFFGSLASNGKRADQFFSFKFERFFSSPFFVVFENDPTWSSKTDLALVFSKSFIEKFFKTK